MNKTISIFIVLFVIHSPNLHASPAKALEVIENQTLIEELNSFNRLYLLILVDHGFTRSQAVELASAQQEGILKNATLDEFKALNTRENITKLAKACSLHLKAMTRIGISNQEAVDLMISQHTGLLSRP